MSSISPIRPGRLLSLAAVLLLSANGAQAGFSSTSCLAQKLQAQGKLHQCRGTEEAKALRGKPADVAKCLTKFREKIAKLNAKAGKIGFQCRFVDNGNSITDYDTGLQWVETTDLDDVENYANPLDADNSYRLSPLGSGNNGTAYTEYLSALNACTNIDGSTPAFAGFAAQCDWRLPSSAELQTILLAPYPCGTSPCIDSIFGPTAPGTHWSSTLVSGNFSWQVIFFDGHVVSEDRKRAAHVRAVRGGL